MERLTIHAASPESGRAILAALSSFRAEMLETGDGRCEVVITLQRGDAEIVALLNALEQHVTKRGRGPAQVEFNGRTYVMHPETGR